MKKLCLLSLLFLVGCGKQVLEQEPLGYSFMPNYLDFDSINVELPKTPEEVIDSSLPHFKQIVVDSGEVVPKDGILISDRKAAEFVFYRAGYKRQEKELEMSKYLMKEYYDKAKSAEVLYQERIVELEKKAKRSWLEKNIGYFGFAAGLVTVILTVFGLGEAI